MRESSHSTAHARRTVADIRRSAQTAPRPPALDSPEVGLRASPCPPTSLLRRASLSVRQVCWPELGARAARAQQARPRTRVRALLALQRCRCVECHCDSSLRLVPLGYRAHKGLLLERTSKAAAAEDALASSRATSGESEFGLLGHQADALPGDSIWPTG